MNRDFHIRQFAILIIIFLAAFTNAKAAYDGYDTELHRATKNGDLNRVQQILTKDPKLISSIDGYGGQKPIHVAVYYDKIYIVKYLISKGADVNARDSNNGTPLMIASNLGHLDILRCLIANGADINAKNNQNKTAMNVSGNPIIDFYFIFLKLSLFYKNCNPLCKVGIMVFSGILIIGIIIHLYKRILKKNEEAED